ncbi:MAG: site-specific integrase [Alphaproteobacteria bacterium]|nr:site-specific integrase [Alphaproteobacteria bacterium]
MASEAKKPGRRRKGQRKDGLIAVYGDYGRRPDGSRDRKTFYGHTWEEADAQRKAYAEERKLGAPFGSDKITVSEWCDEWFSNYKPKVKGTNRVSYNAYIARLKNDLGFALVRDVLHIHLQASLNKMSGMSMSSITKYKMVLQQVFARARQNKIIRDDPSEMLEIPEGTEGEHRALERWEADFIVEHWSEYRTGLWIMLMLLAGLRRGEMSALSWDSIDLTARTITVFQAAEYVSNQPVIKDTTKTDAGMRTLPICDALYVALCSVPKAHRTGLVCLSAHKKPLSQRAMEKGLGGFNVAMERLLNGEPVKQQGRRKDVECGKMTEEEIAAMEKRAKERKRFEIRMHDLRYTFATALYDAGVDVKTAQYYLGHADIRMTMELYTRISKERENLARAKTISFLDSWFKKEPPTMRSEQ